MKDFGRFKYMGKLWGSEHVWSTTDPPNYGATISLAADGSLTGSSNGDRDDGPARGELFEAQRIVREAMKHTAGPRPVPLVKPDADVIELLERTLEEARKGDVRGVVVLSSKAGQNRHALAGWFEYGQVVLGLELAKADFIDAARREEG